MVKLLLVKKDHYIHFRPYIFSKTQFQVCYSQGAEPVEEPDLTFEAVYGSVQSLTYGWTKRFSNQHAEEMSFRLVMEQGWEEVPYELFNVSQLKVSQAHSKKVEQDKKIAEAQKDLKTFAGSYFPTPVPYEESDHIWHNHHSGYHNPDHNWIAEQVFQKEIKVSTDPIPVYDSYWENKYNVVTTLFADPVRFQVTGKVLGRKFSKSVSPTYCSETELGKVIIELKAEVVQACVKYEQDHQNPPMVHSLTPNYKFTHVKVSKKPMLSSWEEQILLSDR
jgi:hypothetical protein